VRQVDVSIRTLTRAFALCGILFAEAATSQVGPQPQRVAIGDSYRIAGILTNASTGEPINRAVVEVLSEEDQHTMASCVTDSEGRFALDRLAAAKYQLRASKRGFHVGFYEEHEGFFSAIVTGPDQDTTHLEFKLEANAILSGVVTDDAGEPVSGARVMLFKRPTFQGEGDRISPAGTASTDDTGTYEFGNLSAGEYLMAVLAEPWYAVHEGSPARRNPALDVAYPVTYFDSTTEEQSAKPIVVAAGNHEQANISLHAVPALRLSAPLVRATDYTMATPQLQQNVFGTGFPYVSVGMNIPPGNTAIEMSGIAPGSYTLTQGNPQRVVDLDLTSSVQVDPNAGAPANPVGGRIRMLSGAPAPDDMMVTLMRIDNGPGQPVCATEARQGSFRFEGVPPGDWAFAVTSGGRTLPVMTVSAGSAKREGNIFTLRDRAPQLAVTLSDAATNVQGFANKNDKGFTGAMIVLLPKNPAQWRALARRDQSDSDGSFALHEVAPGQYTLVAIENGWDLDWTSPTAMARYLPSGMSVRVTEQSGALMRLSTPVAVQER
jgi:protocatechuate 3,4-dioxygenase beta subunit